ncbi:alanine racemase [Fodinibius sediminis]|uniref:Alanine racemase n=1 Tax=Fodinibius sediminis TaxID=1214077 RepID=A0A521DWM1_9BACT|nr:alanine racemase [Fodinibius sediminis]SMO76113.1 alanine racemase [Fodinibius sediminis]
MIRKSNSTVTVNHRLLLKNLATFSRFLDPETRIMAVVKSDGYGHGAVEIAQTLDAKVQAFAVNAIQEGIELRENGIAKPILVFEVPQQKMVSQYRVHNLTATISSREHFEWVPNGTSYHLNFDTGMGRLGFLPSQAEEIAQMVREYSELFCTGIYSHFATAHEPGFPLVSEQHDIFRKIQSHFPEELTAHIANTGGTAFYDTSRFNMVRLGIGLYGYAPGDITIEGLAPILRWHSFIAQTKRIKAGASVSYGAEWQAPADGYLGILPVGYEDGLKRGLSGRQFGVHIGGNTYKVVGTITMNYCMVYLGQDYYEPGTEVELLYKGNDAYEWARKLDTIPYEILTGIDKQIPREHLQYG